MRIALLGSLRPPRRRGLVRLALLLGSAGLLALAFSRLDLRPSYAHIKATLLSGPGAGNYYALADRLSARAAAQRGRLGNQATQGSVDNLERLAQASHDGACGADFALVQDGVPVPAGAELELLGRLPRTEAVFLLGRAGHRFASFADLKGATVGVGPERSGIAQLGRALFAEPDLRGLAVRLVNHPVAAQLDLLARGELDLAMLVTDEDAALIREAVQRPGLELVSFPGLEGLARRFSTAGVDRLPIGRYDAVRGIPARDTAILRVDTLVVAGPCANRAERIALLTLLATELPSFVVANQGRAAPAGLPLASAARQFLVTGEPDWADRYVPWLVNVMPPTNWVYVVMSFSLLLNAMNFANRFRLWRMDQRRERLDDRAAALFGRELTYAQIAALDRAAVLAEAEARAKIERLLDDFVDLRQLCRQQASSLLVPMGQEMSYRYQEALIEEAIAALATFCPGRLRPTGA